MPTRWLSLTVPTRLFTLEQETQGGMFQLTHTEDVLA